MSRVPVSQSLLLRLAFVHYLRTGQRRALIEPDIGYKFNPWHDEANGRFTFVGRGRYFGNGSFGDGSRLAPSGRRITAHQAIAGDTSSTSRSHSSPPLRGSPHVLPEARSNSINRGGELFGGGGATGSWVAPDDPRSRQHIRTRSVAQRKLSAIGRAGIIGNVDQDENSPANWRTISRNGYKFPIDRRGRPRGASGELRLNMGRERSRQVQALAGGTDRRASDHGGHFIARRFDGPPEAFNHFAQDAKFNLGAYKATENKWADAIAHGKHVRVAITPIYLGLSQRPNSIFVEYWIDNMAYRRNFPNESGK